MGLFRDHLNTMTGYVPGEQPQYAGVIKLNTNENAYPPSPLVFEAIREVLTERLRFYPDPVSRRLREAVGKVFNVDPDCVIACNGSDEALTMLVRTTLETSDLLVSPNPSYPLYRTLAQIQGCRFEARPFSDGSQLPAGLSKDAKLTFIANPNSPTGTIVPASDIAKLSAESTGLVVSDEAYGDFATETCLPLVADHPKLVVTRSLSKGYSLAGLRIGFLVAPRPVCEQLLKVKESYNLDAIAIAAGAAALLDQEYHQKCATRILATRSRMESAFAKLGFRVTPSSANFVWITSSKPVQPIYAGLKERNILIRYLRYGENQEGLRISVGTDEEIDRLLDEIAKLV